MNELSDFIKDYGGYAGAASVLGLAVLSLLYFAQAREVKRLREWAGRAPERAAELEQRVSTDATRRTITPMPQRTPPPRPGQPQTAAAQGGAPKPAPGNGQAPAAPAAAPAAAGAAATAATGAPTPGAPAAPTAPTVSGAPAAAAAAPTASTAAPTATPATGGDGDKAPSDPPVAAPAPTPAPSPAPASAPAAASTTPPAPGPRTAAARPRPAVPAAPLRTSTPSATVPPRGPRAADAERPRHTLGIVAGVLGVIAVGLVLFFVLSGGDDGEQSAEEQPPVVTTTDTVPPAGGAEPDRAARGDVKVAVFNATTVNGLANRVADKIESSGWARDEVSNAPPPPKSATILYYAEGAKAQAREVARVIEVGGDGVVPMDQDVRALDDDARVIVIVGADQQQG